MSHVDTIDLHVKDLDALKCAAEKMGLYFREQPTYKWFGRSVGDHAIPEGFTAADLGKCEFAIGLPATHPDYKPNSYEVGIVKRRDGKPGYLLQVDSWQGGYGLMSAVGAGCGKLKQHYTAIVTKRMLAKKGIMLRSETRTKDGKLKLVLS